MGFFKSFFVSLIIIIPIFVAYYGLTIGLVYYHEEAHVSIYRSFGVPADYHVDFYYMDGYTYPLNMTLANERCSSDSRCNMLHQQNEIIGYNITILKDTIFMTVGILIIIMWLIFIMLNSILKYISTIYEEVVE